MKEGFFYPRRPRGCVVEWRVCVQNEAISVGPYWKRNNLKGVFASEIALDMAVSIVGRVCGFSK